MHNANDQRCRWEKCENTQKYRLDSLAHNKNTLLLQRKKVTKFVTILPNFI